MKSEHRWTDEKWTLETGRAIVTPSGTFALHKCNDWDHSDYSKLDEIARGCALLPELADALRNLCFSLVGMPTTLEIQERKQEARALLARIEDAEITIAAELLRKPQCT